MPYYSVDLMTAKKGDEEANDKCHDCGSDECYPNFVLIASKMGLLSELVFGTSRIVISLCVARSFPITPTRIINSFCCTNSCFCTCINSVELKNIWPFLSNIFLCYQTCYFLFFLLKIWLSFLHFLFCSCCHCF